MGCSWQWHGPVPTAPYPGFSQRPVPGEYNGKFMSFPDVLRGRVFLTPAQHARPTYRNFFPPGNRWMASGFAWLGRLHEHPVPGRQIFPGATGLLPLIDLHPGSADLEAAGSGSLSRVP